MSRRRAHFSSRRAGRQRPHKGDHRKRTIRLSAICRLLKHVAEGGDEWLSRAASVSSTRGPGDSLSAASGRSTAERGSDRCCTGPLWNRADRDRCFRRRSTCFAQAGRIQIDRRIRSGRNSRSRRVGHGIGIRRSRRRPVGKVQIDQMPVPFGRFWKMSASCPECLPRERFSWLVSLLPALRVIDRSPLGPALRPIGTRVSQTECQIERDHFSNFLTHYFQTGCGHATLLPDDQDQETKVSRPPSGAIITTTTGCHRTAAHDGNAGPSIHSREPEGDAALFQKVAMAAKPLPCDSALRNDAQQRVVGLVIFDFALP